MAVSPPGVNTTPIRKAYDELDSKVNDLNKQVRNQNIKTILKVSLFLSSWMALGVGLLMLSFSLAGIALPLTTWSLKAVSIFSLDILIVYAVGTRIHRKLSDGARKTEKEFFSKIKEDLKKTYKKNSVDINRSLFGTSEVYQVVEERTFIKPSIKFSSDYSKLELDSYETVEKRYIDIEQEKIRRQEEQNIGYLRFLRSFFKKQDSA